MSVPGSASPTGPGDAAASARVIAALRRELDRLEAAAGAQRVIGHAEPPAWLRPSAGEHRLPVACVIALAITLQLLLPTDLQLKPEALLPGLEIALSIGLLIASPGRISRSSRALRLASMLLIASISLANAWSAARLIKGLVLGASLSAESLLGRGGAIYATNIIVFGLWYWELDRGGPAARAQALSPYPDFLFPQQANPELAPEHWRPVFWDYLWLSYTNATAFSPTDVMPLSRWAKCLMFVQSAISLTTVALVVARAVNILR